MDPKQTGANAPATPKLDEEVPAPQTAYRVVDLLEIEEADCHDRSFVVSGDYEEKLDRDITQLEKELREVLFGTSEKDDARSIWGKDVKSVNWFVPKEKVLMNIEYEVNRRGDRNIIEILQHNAMLRLYLQEHPGARIPERRCECSYDATTQMPSLGELAEIRKEIESRLIKMWQTEMCRYFVQDCNLYARNSYYANIIDETEAADAEAVRAFYEAANESFPLRLPLSEGGTPDRDEAVRAEALYYHPDFVYSPRRSPVNDWDAAADDWDNEGYASDDLDGHSSIDFPEVYYELLPEFLSPEHRANGYELIGPWDYDEPQEVQVPEEHHWNINARDDNGGSIFNLIEGVHFVNVSNEEYRFPVCELEEQEDIEHIHDPHRDHYNQDDEMDEELMEMQRGLADIVRPVRINGLGYVVYLPVASLRRYENGHPLVVVDQNHPLVANMIKMFEFPCNPDVYNVQDREDELKGAAQDETEDGREDLEDNVIDSEYDRLSECKPPSLPIAALLYDDDTLEVTYKRPCEEAQCDGPSPKKSKPNLQLNWQMIRKLKLTKAEYLRDIGMYKMVYPPNQYRGNQSSSPCRAQATAITADNHLGWYNQQMTDYGHLLRTGSEDLSYVNIDYMDSLLADNLKEEEVTLNDDDKTNSDMETVEELANNEARRRQY